MLETAVLALLGAELAKLEGEALKAGIVAARALIDDHERRSHLETEATRHRGEDLEPNLDGSPKETYAEREARQHRADAVTKP